jgi:predicted metal-dependent peptidase
MTTIHPKEWNEIKLALLDHHSLFYKIGEMGVPYLTESIPTACVVFDKTGNFINFLFNPILWKKSSLYEKTFIVCHEALHIILRHGYRFKDAKNDSAANVAMDISINHSLVDRFGFVRENISEWEELCWIDTVFKDDKNLQNIPKDESAEYYLNLLNRKNKTSFKKLLDEHQFFDGDTKSVFDKLNKELSKEEKETIQKFIEKHGPVKEYGNTAGNSLDVAGNLQIQVKKKWETVVKKWTQKHLVESSQNSEQWARKHRRFSVIDSSMFLPSEMEIEDMHIQEGKLNVLFFLDTSGSCYHLKDRFFNSAESLPKHRFNVQLFCFDTKVTSTDVQSRKIYGGGGTSFVCIENYIQQMLNKKELSKYPDAVWIMTDGYGDKVFPQKPENWIWFIDGSEEQLKYVIKNYLPTNSTCFSLKDFI